MPLPLSWGAGFVVARLAGDAAAPGARGARTQAPSRTRS